MWFCKCLKNSKSGWHCHSVFLWLIFAGSLNSPLLRVRIVMHGWVALTGKSGNDDERAESGEAGIGRYTQWQGHAFGTDWYFARAIEFDRWGAQFIGVQDFRTWEARPVRMRVHSCAHVSLCTRTRFCMLVWSFDDVSALAKIDVCFGYSWCVQVWADTVFLCCTSLTHFTVRSSISCHDSSADCWIICVWYWGRTCQSASISGLVYSLRVSSSVCVI